MGFRHIVAISLAICLCMCGCTQSEEFPTTDPTFSTTAPTSPTTESTSPTIIEDVQPMIYLYGEVHSRGYIIDLELQLWQTYYHEYGMRHLFMESAYFTSEMLNLWMKADNDSILDLICDTMKGTHAGSEVYRDFYIAIKQTCPDTVFHGTDVGHGYDTLGAWYLNYLQEHGLTDSEEYMLTEEAIAQGNTFYHEAEKPNVYRENTMTENFIREFDALDGEKVMGIYGSAHVDLYALNHTKECDAMGKQLKSRYGELVASEDLYERALHEAMPKYTENIVINGKTYPAEYYGLIEVSVSNPEYLTMEFWHLIGAYDDFYNGTNTGNIMYQYMYPMLLQKGEGYLIRYHHADGTFHFEYYICNGKYKQGELYTLEVSLN